MNVSVAILKDAGYPVGLVKDEAAVTLAERQVRAAYFPATETFETDEALNLLYALTFSMLLKRRTISTRTGAVQKVSQYTIAADNEQVRQEIRGYCRQPLEAYITGLEGEFEPEDILEIYDRLFLI